MADEAQALAAAVVECRRAGKTVRIVGHGSKPFGGAEADARLSIRGHTGIIDYRPQELVLTARAGTPLAEVAAALAERKQMLPFDPPRFGGAAGEGTFGGAVASGLAGPARPWRGGVRDAVLGVEMINGMGERLRFGGSVMKNVAGFDVSRLMAGARGTLGVILSASVRVAPAPAAEETWGLPCDAAQAGALCRRWARSPLPLTGTCHVAGCLRVRLSGSAPALAAARAEMGLRDAHDPSVWEQVRDHRHPFFAADPQAPLARISLPRGARFEDDDALIEWGGCQAWRNAEGGTALPPGAFATAFRGASAPPTPRPVASGYAKRIKQAFDPDGMFNPGIAP